jgi:uncharacterized protein YndB with AHSA1/START domain
MADHTFKAEPNSLAVEATYVFDAPADKVFERYTDQALIPKWWVPEGSGLRVEKMDVRDAGEWRFVMSDGQDFLFRGVYHKVVKNELIVGTWAFDAMPSVVLHTTTFENLPDGKAKITEQFVFQSVEDREAMMKSGMDEESVVGMMDRLAKLI